MLVSAPAEEIQAEEERENNAAHALGRSQEYWLLSRLFAEVPGDALLAEAREALAGVSADALVEFIALRDAVAAVCVDSQTAAVAYTRYLSLLPKDGDERFPFESHVREGVMPGEATRLVAAFMADAGYETLTLPVASPDHLAAELCLMAFLCHAESVAWEGDDRAAVRDSLIRQRAFLRTHLAAWAPDYCDALAARADHPYLRALARLAARVVREDVAVVAAACANVNRAVTAEDAPAPAVAGAQ